MITRAPTDAQRSAPAARAELDAAVGAWRARYDLASVQPAADAAAIGKPPDRGRTPPLVARGRLREVETPGGTTRAFVPPPVIAGYTPPMGSVSALGPTPTRSPKGRR